MVNEPSLNRGTSQTAIHRASVPGSYKWINCKYATSEHLLSCRKPYPEHWVIIDLHHNQVTFLRDEVGIYDHKVIPIWWIVGIDVKNLHSWLVCLPEFINILSATRIVFLHIDKPQH